MMERKVLGRGLDALITAAPAQDTREKVQNIPIDLIKASRFQPRTKFTEAKIAELASSIKEKGIIQPVLLRPLDNGQYELVAGERRFRAAGRVGIKEVPAIVRKISDPDLLETSIIENVQREELNSLEEAKAYQRLATEFGYSQDDIAKKVGKDKSTISNLLRILNLPEDIQSFVSDNTISMGHAKVLLSLVDATTQIDFCRRIVEKGLSVRQAEAIVSRQVRSRIAKKRTADPQIRSLEEKMEQFFGTKVRLKHGRKRGKILIEYYSLDDLDRVLKKLGLQGS